MNATRDLSLVSSALAVSCMALSAAAAELPPPNELRGWIETMKTAERGPFENIRWFCKDGTVLPPKPYACKDHGGGIQHGALNARARALRDGGYEVATVLASVDPSRFVGPDADLDGLKQILLERFLISWDDGWVMRATRTYRGSLQSEDEEAGAAALVMALLGDRAWREPNRFFLLREAVRLLPLQGDEVSASEVRTLALQIAKDDASFRALRIKIHNAPEAGDAAAVREYSAERGKQSMAPRYEELAAAIDRLYSPAEATQAVVELAGALPDSKAASELRDSAGKLGSDTAAPVRFATATQLLGRLRDLFAGARDPALSLQILQTSLAVELAVFRDGSTVLQGLDRLSRIERLWLLNYTAEALRGAGFMGPREVEGLTGAVVRLEQSRTPPLSDYRSELQYLARALEWAARWVEFNFELTVARWAPLEPQAHLYSQDRLRGSPVLFYSGVIDSLIIDATHRAGIVYDLFGERVGAGLRALNPGLARGTLHQVEGEPEAETVDPEGIYLVPQTLADLPRVNGILTQGEGSSLSHVQLLARNLGIPNVVVADSALPKVTARVDERVVLAVSPGGVVQLHEDGPQWNEVFGVEEATPDLEIVPDLEKLDLTVTGLTPLSGLRAADSGRLSGPKGANLGELKHFFGNAVPDGFVIPFGVFRSVLDRPLEPGGPKVFEWMKQNYDDIEAAADKPKKQREMIRKFLARLRDWIENVDPGPEFRQAIETALETQFGPDGSFGVFVRSDTNVEDLPGFTGAGLNLTVFNVVGTENILQSIRDVWSSPFTERAYGWRQQNMTQPEYVFPAVVVQLALPSDKSGVMVTSDVETGDTSWLTIACSEGVGGAVEGQATESLLVHAKTGEVRFLARATAPEQTALVSTGGVTHVAGHGPEHLLSQSDIRKLVALARDVRARFTSLEGAPADIEYAFKGGRLYLLQIRPFVESQKAQQSAFLTGLDAGSRALAAEPVTLYAIPEPGDPNLRASAGATP